jgi:group I intron endonuclease
MLVYALINTVNDKVYIGQHCGYDLTKRWNNRLTNDGNAHLLNAIRKYGCSAFARQILAYCSTQQEMDLIERFWIAAYQSTDRRFGYNLQKGGRIWHGGYTQDIRQRISQGLKRSWRMKSPEQQAACSKLMRQLWRRMSPSERKFVAERARIAWYRKSPKEVARMRKKVSAALRAMWQWRKENGVRVKRHTEERKRRISEGVRRYWAKRRRQSTSNGKSIKQIALQREETMPKTRDQVANELAQEAAQIVLAAVNEIKAGRSITSVKYQLREIARKLTELEWNLRGGCSW